MDILEANRNRTVWTLVSCRVTAEMKSELIRFAASYGLNVNQFLAMLINRAMKEKGEGQMNLFDKVGVEPIKLLHKKKGRVVVKAKKGKGLDRKQAIDFYGVGKVIDFMKSDGVPVHGLKSKLSKLSRDNGSLTWHGWTIEKLRNKYWVG